MMSKLPFSKRLWIPLIASLLCLVALCAFDAYQMRTVRIKEREAALEQVTDSALGVVKDYADKATAGTMSVADAQKQALERVRAMRYGQSGYFAIVDPKVNILMHAFLPKMENKSAKDISDKDGVHMWAEGVRIAQTDGHGFLTYVWPKPGAQSDVPKLAYVAAYKPWGWTLVTGAYTDDINAAFMASLYQTVAFLAFSGVLLSVVVVAVNRGLRRSLGGELEYAADIAHRIADNDLSVVVETAPDDKDSLLYAMKRMREQLIGTVGAIKTASDSIAIASSQIAAGNQDLSQRTEEQAASLEETAASMEQLTSTVTQNADNAHQANQVVAQAVEVAEQGGAVVSRVVDAMSSINASAGKIVEIIGTIESIAFQTNILALNAAVEAARAGEQGRGFAVVASEVRSLAQRSSAASKEIRQLIHDSVERVRAGADYAEEAGGAMDRIMHEVRRVTDLMGEIAASSQEQSKGIGQVNQAVAQMDQVTQQNAALVEQAAAAASSLEAQAKELKAAVSSFKLDTSHSAVGNAVMHARTSV